MGWAVAVAFMDADAPDTGLNVPVDGGRVPAANGSAVVGASGAPRPTPDAYPK
jgi:hypothetical protein